MDVSDIWVADDPCSISLSDDSSTLSVIVDSGRSTLTDTAVAVAVTVVEGAVVGMVLEGGSPDVSET